MIKHTVTYVNWSDIQTQLPDSADWYDWLCCTVCTHGDADVTLVTKEVIADALDDLANENEEPMARPLADMATWLRGLRGVEYVNLEK